MRTLNGYKQESIEVVFDSLKNEIFDFIKNDEDNIKKIYQSEISDVVENFLNDFDLYDEIHEESDRISCKADYYMMSDNAREIEKGFDYFKDNFGSDVSDCSIMNMIEKGVYCVIYEELNNYKFNSDLEEYIEQLVKNKEFKDELIELIKEYNEEEDIDEYLTDEEIEKIIDSDLFDFEDLENLILNNKLNKKLVSKNIKSKVSKI